ncbi:AAA+-type ATPase [Pleurotus ostreatus]|uniref:AAA+-type ATPase n=1 Tax=Pleurotus ostreatus TaxID=5322 RepID=A0A8H7DNA3_PLEOS|nr:AAA+-type ATPase [Pleurotus ostreatus]KAF7422262.1 AAA+-type ATPase [Pleurotus ostreatus]
MASALSKTFTVSLHEGLETVHRAARRVICSTDFLKAAKLSAGDVIAIAGGSDLTPVKVFAVGVVWPSMDLSQDTISVSFSLLLTAGLEVGAQARIYPLAGLSSSTATPGLPSLRQIQEARIIRLKETSPDGTKPSGSASKTRENNHRDWLSLLIRELIVDLKYLTSKQVIEVRYEGQLRRFSIASIASDKKTDAPLEDAFTTLSVTPSPNLWTASWDTQVILLESDKAENAAPAFAPKPEVEALVHSSATEAYASVGGLSKQIAQIRDLLEIPLTRPDLFRHFGLKPPRGILLHGPPGTGKTHLARAIASSTNSSVLVINGPELSSAYHGETEARLRDVFNEAKEKSPCIVILDEVDALAPRREEGAGGEVEKRVVATLLTILDGVEDESAEDQGRVVVIGTTNRPNAIDPALRRPGRFDREIEVGIPDAEDRLAIIEVLLHRTPHSISQDELRAIASRAHGYVGADLSAVVREAGTVAIKRWLASSISADGSTSGPTMELADLVAALPTVRPSAMRSLFVESPPIRYADIGGQASVIQKLKEAVEWPLVHPEAFQRLGVKPPKGILLYGPPGCSKTVLARACACESGVNFLAVKGPELLNKFVGESERAVREIFRKARAASPSIIFFDEIDALASSRGTGGDTASSHEGVLTSLLNEMDGVQELLGVTIIGATNRPDAIDSALMRPGRLDRILYVGPPDQSGREEILRIHTRKMAIDPDTDFVELAALTDGCSGAEIASLCQEAALLTMKSDIHAPFIPHEALRTAATTMKRQITASITLKFQQWTLSSGLKHV